MQGFVLLALQGRLSWIMGIALPLAVIAALFLVDWRVRSKAALPLSGAAAQYVRQ
jgi:hypothetical protein